MFSLVRCAALTQTSEHIISVMIHHKIWKIRFDFSNKQLKRFLVGFLKEFLDSPRSILSLDIRDNFPLKFIDATYFISWIILNIVSHSIICNTVWDIRFVQRSSAISIAIITIVSVVIVTVIIFIWI